MGYEFGYHKRVLNETNLSDHELKRIEDKIEDMVTNQWRDLTDYDVEEIKDTDYDMYRARVGDYRVIFALGDRRAAILRIDSRDTVYRNLAALEDRLRSLFGG